MMSRGLGGDAHHGELHGLPRGEPGVEPLAGTSRGHAAEDAGEVGKLKDAARGAEAPGSTSSLAMPESSGLKKAAQGGEEKKQPRGEGEAQLGLFQNEGAQEKGEHADLQDLHPEDDLLLGIAVTQPASDGRKEDVGQREDGAQEELHGIPPAWCPQPRRGRRR